MRELLLSLASPESLSWVGFLLLVIGLLGEVAVLIVPSQKYVLHASLGLLFAATVVVGVVIEHIGDDAILKAVETRAIKAEQRLADRTLSDEKIAEIGAQLAPFAGQQFTMNTYWQSKEPTNFTKRIGENALIAVAHWQFIRPTGFLVGQVSGVTVDVANDADERTKEAAAALVSALKAADVDATAGHDQVDKTIISITVGTK